MVAHRDNEGSAVVVADGELLGPLSSALGVEERHGRDEAGAAPRGGGDHEIGGVGGEGVVAHAAGDFSVKGGLVGADCARWARIAEPDRSGGLGVSGEGKPGGEPGPCAPEGEQCGKHGRAMGLALHEFRGLDACGGDLPPFSRYFQEGRRFSGTIDSARSLFLRPGAPALTGRCRPVIRKRGL